MSSYNTTLLITTLVWDCRCLQRVFLRATLTLRVSLAASAWRRRRAASAYVQIWRHPQNRKYVSYHYAARGPSETRPQVACTTMATIGRVVPKIWSRTEKHTHRQTRSSQYFAPLPRGGVIMPCIQCVTVNKLRGLLSYSLSACVRGIHLFTL